MKCLAIIVFLLFSPRQSASDKPYELKGEAPGITSLKQFKSNHKHSDCIKRSDILVSCHVAGDISFAGVPACNASPDCANHGIFAEFVSERMVRLRYVVSIGSVDKIIAALTAKYGEPTKSTPTSAKWKNSVGTLDVGDFNGLPNEPLPMHTHIESALNDQSESKDI
jgi:hypothetical protein